MSDETAPKMVSRMQTEVQLPENCQAILADRAFITTAGLAKGDVFALAASQAFLYDTHYCSVDRQKEPTIAACASFASGLRVYDIRDPEHPTEIAYWNAGLASTGAGALGANLAVARPVIRSDLAQIWFPDAFKGFHVLQFRDGVWPFAKQDPCPARDPYLAQYDLGYKACRAERHRVVQLPGARPCRTRPTLTLGLRRKVRRARVFVNGRLARTVRGHHRRITLRGLPRARFTVRVVARLAGGRTVVRTRRYRSCIPQPRARAAGVSSVSQTVITPQMRQSLERVLLLCRLSAQQRSV
jgi:hypothetical protein